MTIDILGNTAEMTDVLAAAVLRYFSGLEKRYIPDEDRAAIAAALEVQRGDIKQALAEALRTAGFNRKES